MNNLKRDSILREAGDSLERLGVDAIDLYQIHWPIPALDIEDRRRERIERLPEDDWRKHNERFREPELSEHLALVERLQAVADRRDMTPGAVAVAWTLRNAAVDGAIVGFRHPDQVDPIVTAVHVELGDDDVATIEGRA